MEDTTYPQFSSDGLDLLTIHLQFSPDGLDPLTIDLLLTEVQAELYTAAEPTSALLDGSAAERRRRRMERRAMSAVVRALPVRRQVSTSDGQEAA